MSTRSLIQFDNGVVVYRHSDGYPSGVLSDLKTALLKGVRPYDTEYFIGGFIQQMGAKHQKWLDEYYSDKERSEYPSEWLNSVLGYGVLCGNIKELDYGQEFCYKFNEKSVTVCKWNGETVKRITYEKLLKMNDDDIYNIDKEFGY